MRKFGAYEILHELKSGGMGSVLLARKRGLGAFEQLVAIKTIRPEFASSPAVRAMFLDEAAILASLNHPGVATVHDFGEDNGTLYMVMEYVAGIPFRELLEHKPPPTVIARAILEACRGLHAAHERTDLAGQALELVHRDISPDNLMLGFDGHVKVIDFGIALVKKNRQAPVTEFGTVKGKPPYMSPEQIANEPMDRRSDVFSLGVVLWELLTHRTLFEGDSIYSIALAVTKQPIVPPSQMLDEPLPIGLDAAVMNALERDLATRTPTAAAFAEQLEPVIGGSETLESWAERELAHKRDQHRAWLADLTSGVALPKAVGRATGQMTEVAAVPNAPAAVAPVVPEALEESPTSVGRDDGLSIPPRNRTAPIVILLLALLVAGGVAYVALTSRSTSPTLADAQPIVPIDVIVQPDAAVDAPIDTVTEVVVDARVVVVVAHDARVPILTVRADAAVPHDSAPPSGSGTITIKYKPGPYANISIDNGPALPGPIFRRKVAAGRHTIKFLDAKTGDVLDEQAVDVHDTDALTIRQRE